MDQSGEAISKFPLQEKLFRSIERQQNLKESFISLFASKKEKKLQLPYLPMLQKQRL